MCRQGLDVIQTEAWRFYRTLSGVRLCWELEEPQGPEGPDKDSSHFPGRVITSVEGYLARKKTHPPRTLP